MDKLELSAYLLNLHELMKAIDPTPKWMADEYAKHWDMFKEEVQKEDEDD